MTFKQLFKLIQIIRAFSILSDIFPWAMNSYTKNFLQTAKSLLLLWCKYSPSLRHVSARLELTRVTVLRVNERHVLLETEIH